MNANKMMLSKLNESRIDSDCGFCFGVVELLDSVHRNEEFGFCLRNSEDKFFSSVLFYLQ